MSTITDELFYQPPLVSHPGQENIHTYHIFFITGNPGLIKYYHGFLAELSQLLSSSTSTSASPIANAPKNQYHVFGTSLAGFKLSSHRDHAKRPIDDKIESPPFSLKRQIELVETKLLAYAQSRNTQTSLPNPESTSSQNATAPTSSASSNVSKSPVKIILVGHSVGSYILLELLRRHKAAPPTGVDIVGGVLLFPTVTHIAKSPSGLKLGSILQLQYIAVLAGLVVRLLSWLIPRTIFFLIVRVVTGFPVDAAQTTLDFLTSPAGVREALHMSRDELNEITEDQWDADVWGASVPGEEKDPARLVFYFGQNDHWVADHTRDDLIAARAANPRKGKTQWPRMMIDEDGVPHSFCIRHSTLIAEKVKTFVEAIARDEQKASLPRDEENSETPWMVSRSWMYL